VPPIVNVPGALPVHAPMAHRRTHMVTTEMAAPHNVEACYVANVVSLQQLWAFAAAAFVIIVVPGPSVLFVVSRGIALGRRAALATVLGNAIGAGCAATLVAVGVGPIITRSLVVFSIMKFVGAAYLVLLGWKSLRHRGELARSLTGDVAPLPTRQIIKEGFIVGVTNPKVFVFFAAILPQFVDRQSSSVPMQMLILGALFVTIALISDGLWGVLAGTIRSWIVKSPRRLETVGGLGGLAIMGLGVRLAVSGRHD
jgi:threonine/homoserine/homoserine lactone efflux protein